MPPCCDAVLLLASLAHQDGVFACGVNVLTMMDTVDMSLFASSKYIEIPMAAECAERFVFRKFVRQQDDVRFWRTSDIEPWTTSGVRVALAKAAKSLGFIDFKPYVFRRLTSNALNRSEITEDDRRQAVGHRNGTCTFLRSYMSKRTTIDIQGIVWAGQENRELIEEHGLRRILPASLTPAEAAQIDHDPLVVSLRNAYTEVSFANCRQLNFRGRGPSDLVPLTSS